MNVMKLCNEKQTSLRLSAQLLCSYICLELGDWERAQDMSEPMISDDSEQTRKYLSRIYSAQSLFMMNNYDEAERPLVRSIVEVRWLNPPREHLLSLWQTAARIYKAKGEIEKSKKHMEKCTQETQNKSDREVVLTMVAADLRGKRIQEALKSLDEYQSG